MGRSLILGSATAVVGVAVVPGLLAALATSLQLPVAVPWYQRWSIDGGPAWFLASGAIPTVGPFVAIGSIAFLLIGRIIVARDLGAWALVFLVCCGINAWMVTFGKPWTMGAPLCIAIPVLVYSTALVILFAKEGLLAGAVSSTVGLALLATPLTSDFTRWYAWRGAVVVLLITAVAYWGFRNVLGRQSAFPATAL